MCSVTINAFEWHLLHLFAGESTHLAMWRFPRNLKCWRQSLRKHNSKVFSDKKTDKMECMWSHWGEPEQSRCWDKQETRKVNLLHSLVDRSSHWNYSLFFFSLPLSYSVSIFILATFPFLLFLFTCPQPRLSLYSFFLSLSLWTVSISNQCSNACSLQQKQEELLLQNVEEVRDLLVNGAVPVGHQHIWK